MAQPTVDRQKSCYACARSKTRCDLGVPSCERCRKRGIECVYAPHTGNPNVRKARKARERGWMASTAWPNTAVAEQQYSNAQHTAPFAADVAEGTSILPWNANSLPLPDTSADETEQDGQRIQWSAAGPRDSFSSVSSSESGVQPYETTPSTSPGWPMTTTNDTFTTANSTVGMAHAFLSNGLNSIVSEASNLDLGGMFSYPTRGGSTGKQGITQDAKGEQIVDEPISQVSRDEAIDMQPTPQARRNTVPWAKNTPPMSRLTTQNLPETKPTTGLRLTIPLTPSRLTGISPSLPALFAGASDLSMWLDDPIVPSPLYELGACTGWNGLLSANDTGKTPTAISSRSADHSITKESRSLLQETLLPSHDERGAAWDRTPGVSPVLISSVDWWAQNTDAQFRFHRSMLDALPQLPFVRYEDQRTSLAVSVISRFLTYTSFMCMAEPSAPQPPFLHRHLLMSQRNKLPVSLAMTRCVLGALALRLPSSDGWAWSQAGLQLEQLLHEAASTSACISEAMACVTMRFKYAGRLEGYLQRTMTFDGIMQLMALLQSMWFYVVVGALSDNLRLSANSPHPGSFAFIHSHWRPNLLPDAVETLQDLTVAVSSVALYLQQHQWDGLGEEMDQYLWWSLCESLRRTLLASHALLILMRFILHATETTQTGPRSGMVSLAHAPFSIRESRHVSWKAHHWESTLAVELPAIADMFEADNVSLWRTLWSNWRESGPAPLTLAHFIAHRPLHTKRTPSDTQYRLDNYFLQHDEFTNVCLSVIFGLTNSH